MTRILTLTFFFGLLLHAGPVRAGDELEKAFANPPESARAWRYWWWLNGAASKDGITRDFEEMKRQGISGALLFDAGTAGPPAPRGPHFMSPEWREMFKHAVREADRLGIALGVNLWPNRLIGDAALTPARRFTVTNVDTYKKDSPLLESGLLGPVTLQEVIP